MKKPIFPLSNWDQPTLGSFDFESSDDIVGAARELIDGNHPGVLTTVDEKGRPHARWMASLDFEDFPHIYTLTAPHSRKLKHIAANPIVEWMFSNQDLSFIINLVGTATPVSETSLLKRIWRSVEDKSHAYFLNNFTERPGVAVIQTRVTGITCSLPQSGLTWSMEAADFPVQSPQETRTKHVQGT
jgi:general stress protein 26